MFTAALCSLDHSSLCHASGPLVAEAELFIAAIFFIAVVVVAHSGGDAVRESDGLDCTRRL